jgi:hypothetical protein
MSDSILIAVKSLNEAAVALKAVAEYRDGRMPILGEGAPAEVTLVDHLRVALGKAPMNPVKQAVLETWLAAPRGVWMAYPELVGAVKAMLGLEEAEASGRTQAALRDLSWQVREGVPAPELSKLHLQKPIEALAERIRSAGTYQYRLTPAGREAVQAFLT